MNKLIVQITKPKGQTRALANLPVNNNKDSIFRYLDSKARKDTCKVCISTGLQLLVIDYYCKLHNIDLQVITLLQYPKQGYIHMDLDEAHYFLNKEYIDLSNKLDDCIGEEDE